MKKRKLLLTIAALLCSAGMWAGTDYTSSMSNSTGNWTGVGSQTPIAVCKTDGVETYQGNTTQFGIGDVLYQTINELPNGFYIISFYAWENYANWEEASISHGSDIAQVFANTTVKGIEVIKSKDDRDWNDANTYTLVAQVTDGTLKYGVKNIAEGGNWAACKPISLTYIGTTDLTELIVNPSFETGNKTGWIDDTTGDKMDVMSTDDLAGKDGNYWVERWWYDSTIDIHQTTPELPAGYYTITARAKAEAGNSIFVYAETEGKERVKTSVGDANDYSVEIYLNSANTIELGLTGEHVTQTHVAVDNFRLTYLGNPYQDLSSAIKAAAEGHTLGFESGEYAPYRNVAALTDLDAARTINEARTATYAEVVAATTALSSATWKSNVGNVECVYNGDFSQGDWGLDGWSRPESWGKNLPSDEPGITVDILKAAGSSTGSAYYNQPGKLVYGDTGFYTMPLKAKTIYTLTFKYASWVEGSNVSVTASVLNSSDGMAAITYGRNANAYTDENAFVTKTIKFVTGAAGNYVLTLANSGNTVMTDVSITKDVNQYLEFADGSVPTYAPGTYPSVKITRTLTAGRWATAIYPFEVSGVDNIAVLDSYDESTGALGFASAAASTANQPFLMRSTADATEITLSDVAVAAVEATDAVVGKASLKGVYATTNITNEAKNFVLSNNKIYSVGAAGATINPYRAYIQIDQSVEVKALNFFIDDDDATGINSLTPALSEGEGAIYNVAGQRMSKMQKGINIVNGKKVLY